MTPILDRIPTGSSSMADWLRFMLLFMDAGGIFNVQSKLAIAANVASSSSECKEGRESGTVVAIILDAIGPCVSIYM